MEAYSVSRIVKSGGHNGPEAILASMALTEKDREDIKKATIGQCNNLDWHLLRTGRLTASNFGSVLQPSDPMKWGIDHEKDAIMAFTSKTNKEVQESGLWLSPSGVLGASPDGLVGSSEILEVKCPFNAKDLKIDKAVETKKIKYIIKEGATYSLRKDHPYWHQVQGQLHITEKQTCHFVVWTTKDCVIIPIRRDEAWKPNLQVLENHFKEHMLKKWAQN